MLLMIITSKLNNIDRSVHNRGRMYFEALPVEKQHMTEALFDMIQIKLLVGATTLSINRTIWFKQTYHCESDSLLNDIH